MNYRWRDDPEIVARLVNMEKIQTIKKQQVLMKPNEACALIVDGRIGDILTETILKNMAGGFTRWLGDKLKITAKDRRIIFAMTSPMDYWIPVSGQIANGEMITGYVNLRMKIELEDIPKLLNYFANNSPVLTRESVVKIIQNELNTRVVIPSLAECKTAQDIRSSHFLDHFEMLSEIEMKNLLSNLGFTLLKANLNAGQTRLEKVAEIKSLTDAKRTEREIALETLLSNHRDSERIKIAEIESATNVAKANIRSKISIELEGEMRSLREKEAIADSNLNYEKRKMEMRKQELEARNNRAIEMFAEVQTRKQQRISNRQTFEKEMFESLTNSQKEMMQLAAKNGSLTPEVVMEMLRQLTKQKALDRKSKVE